MKPLGIAIIFAAVFFLGQGVLAATPTPASTVKSPSPKVSPTTPTTSAAAPTCTPAATTTVKSTSGSGTALFSRPDLPCGVSSPVFEIPNLSSKFNANTTPQDIVTFVVGILALVAGLAAFGYVLYGGFKYISSAGNPAAAEEGKRMIVGAVVGIVIIALSYVTVRYLFALFGGL